MNFEVHSLEEFRLAFNSERACLEHLLKCRWPEGYICPQCESTKYWEIKSPFGYECSSCGRRTSPTAGTAMHGSRLSLEQWFLAIYHVSQARSISAKKLSGELNCSYRTALRVLRLARDSMSSVPRPMLTGDVDAGHSKLRYGKRWFSDPVVGVVFCAVEWPILTQKPFKYERIALAWSTKANQKDIMSFLRRNVATGSRLLAPDWKHHTRAIGKHYRPASYPSSPTFCSRALEELRQWLGSVYRRVDPKYLQSYLDEFAFHFNIKHSPGLAFNNLLAALLTTDEASS